MAGNALLVVASAVTPVATGGIDFTVNLVPCQIVSTMHEITIRAVPVFDRRLHLNFVDMAIITKRSSMTNRTESVVPFRIKPMVPDKGLRMGKRFVGLQNPLYLVGMALAAIDLPLGKRLGVGGGETDSFLLVSMGASGNKDQTTHRRRDEKKPDHGHGRAPLLARARLNVSLTTPLISSSYQGFWP